MNPEQDNIQMQLNRITRLLEAKSLSEYLTITESAELLRCSKSKIRLLLKDGELNFTRVGSSIKSNVIIRRLDLLKLLK